MVTRINFFALAVLVSIVGNSNLCAMECNPLEESWLLVNKDSGILTKINPLKVEKQQSIKELTMHDLGAKKIKGVLPVVLGTGVATLQSEDTSKERKLYLADEESLSSSEQAKVPKDTGFFGGCSSLYLYQNSCSPEIFLFKKYEDKLKKVKEFKLSDSKYINCMAIKDNLLFLGSNGKIFLYDLNTIESCSNLCGQINIDGPVCCLAVLNDKLLASFCGINDITGYEIDQKNSALNEKVKWIGHTNVVGSLAVIDNQFFSGSSDTTIKAWNLATTKELATMKCNNGSVDELTSAGGLLFSNSQFLNDILIWDPKTYQQIGSISTNAQDIRGSTKNLFLGLEYNTRVISIDEIKKKLQLEDKKKHDEEVVIQ